VACEAALKEEFLALPVTGRPRDVIRRHEEQIRYVDLADGESLTDVDYPEDYRRLTASIRPSR
jgi:hypothetical protein